MARTVNNILGGYDLSLDLDRYQEIMHLPIAAFNGLNNPDELVMEQCSSIWTQSSRNMLAQYLAMAEERRETELGYHLSPKYIIGEEHDYQAYELLHRKKLIDVGVELITDIELDVPVTLLDLYGAINDPVQISIATTVTDPNTICTYYPGEDVRITPSNVVIAGGIVTISIPRSRLVKPELLDDREDHLYYADDDNFLETVDVKECRITPVDGVVFQWTPYRLMAIGRACLTDGTSETQQGVSSITGNLARRIAKVAVHPASFIGEVASGARFRFGCIPDMVQLSYVSGEKQYSPNQELLTARYAHTLMPNQPCSCPLVVQYWQEDRKDAEFTSPYGSTMGAQNAWFADSRAKIGIGGIFV